MKLTKRKLLLGLFFALLGTTLSVAYPRPALAANFIDGNGSPASISAGDNTRFIFQDPFNIVDTQAKDANGNPIIYSTKASICDKDNMYQCDTDDTFYPGAYWYWPSGATAASVNGQCVSALVLHIRHTPGGTGLEHAKLILVNAHQGLQGTGCYVQDTDGKKIQTKDIEGWGAKGVDDYNDGSDMVQGHSVDTTVKKSDTVELDKFNSSDKPMFSALATEFRWAGPNEIDSIMRGRQLNKTTDQATIKSISNDLAHGFNEVKQYANGYDYYYNKECVNDQNQLLALLVVKQGDPSNVTIIHRNDGDGSKGYRADNWEGDQQSCLIGQDHTTSPARLWGGTRGTVTLGMADLANFANPGSTKGGAGGTPDPGSGNTTATCESSGFSLSWILCPIINGFASAADNIYTNMIQPLLFTKPIDVGNQGDEVSQKIYQVWSTFRVYGDIFLVIALLVIVFGESLGGGMIDAYTAKKVLPRLLAAAILLNLSIYLVAIMVDITNVIGDSMRQLITAPFVTNDQLKFTPNGGASALGMVAMLGGIAWSVVSLGPLLEFLLAFVLIPAFFILIAILITVLLRRALIILLVLVSPVAFALYCLPNTEKYFKKWWSVLLETLMVYPIIAALFGIANVLSVTIGWAGQTGAIANTFAGILSIIALFVPLLLIPFSFRIAGGILGKVHETLLGYGKKGHEAILGNPNDPNSWRNRARSHLADRQVLNRERAVSSIGNLQKAEAGDKVTAAQARRRRRLGRVLSPVGSAFNFGDLEAKRSAITKKEAELRELKTGYGPDSSVRALFAKKDKDGIWRSTINGATFSDLEVKKAHEIYGKKAGMSASQTDLDYELGKAANTEIEYERFKQQAPAILYGLGYDEEEINGVMKGVGYKNQAKYLDLKHSKFKRQEEDGSWKQIVNHAALAQDTAVNFGSYPVSNMKDVVPRELRTGFLNAHAARDAVAAEGPNVSDTRKAEIYAAHGFTPTTAPDGSVDLTGEQLAQRTIEDSIKIRDSFRGGGAHMDEELGRVIPASGGTGASGRTDAEIREFIRVVEERHPQRQPQPRPGSNRDSGAGGLTLPGDGGFNLPPSQQPRPPQG